MRTSLSSRHLINRSIYGSQKLKRAITRAKALKDRAENLIRRPLLDFAPSIKWVTTPYGPTHPVLLFRGDKSEGSGRARNSNNIKQPTKNELEIVCDFLYKKFGFDYIVQESILNTLKRTLPSRIKATGLKNCDEYLKKLKEDKNELQLILKTLHFERTHFFREANQLKLFMNEILPEIIEKKSRSKHLRIWCAGCSTGEEVYSIAMILLNNPRLKEWKIEIYATDIVTDYLELARKGKYDSKSIKDIGSEEFRAMFERFIKNGVIIQGNESYLINKEAINASGIRIKFIEHNLMDNNYSFVGNPDIIFCRNVLIYFTKEKMCETLEKFYNVLVQDGHLFVGHTLSISALEGIFKKSLGFKYTKYMHYRKIQKE